MYISLIYERRTSVAQPQATSPTACLRVFDLQHPAHDKCSGDLLATIVCIRYDQGLYQLNEDNLKLV